MVMLELFREPGDGFFCITGISIATFYCARGIDTKWLGCSIPFRFFGPCIFGVRNFSGEKFLHFRAVALKSLQKRTPRISSDMFCCGGWIKYVHIRYTCALWHG